VQGRQTTILRSVSDFVSVMSCVCWRVIAAQIIEAVDLTVDPCEDFFKFACGSWNKKHIIPEDKTSYNPFEKLNDELQVILKSKSFSVSIHKST